MSTKKPLFEKVSKLPSRKFGEKVKIYAEVLAAIQQQSKGFYKVNIPDKKPKTVLMALHKRIKEENLINLKVRQRGDNIFIEVLE